MDTVFGTHLGRYILLDKLGEGGMATVYNALDSHLERNVAIKMILPDRQTSQVFLDRFLMEARALAQLSHANIVKVLDYGKQEGVPYLVMEFIQGGTLKEEIGQPWPWQQAAAILAPVARALQYVHSQKIVHRDVKPSNILLNENDQPLLSDFGVVKLLETEDSGEFATGVGVGTPDYMSPEQGMGKEVDYRADIYALGVMFYELVTGQRPYNAETPMGVVIKHVTGPFPRPRAAMPTLPRFVEEVILKAVAKNPDRRFKDMGEFALVLEQLAQGEKIQRRRIREVVQGKRRQRRTCLVSLAALLFLLLITVGSAAFFWVRLQQTPADQPVVQAFPTLQSIPTSSLPAPTHTLRPTHSPTAVSTLTPSPTIAPSLTNVPSLTPTLTPMAQASVALIGTPLPMGLRDLAEGQIKEIARWGIGQVNAVAWAPDGKKIAIGTTDGIFIYTVPDLKRVLFIDTRAWADTDPGSWVEALVFSKSGQLTAALRSGDVFTWDSQSGALADPGHLKYMRPSVERLKDTGVPRALSIAYSATEEYLAVGFENGAINVWNLENVHQPRLHMRKDQYYEATSLAFDSQTRYLYAAASENKIFQWDLSNNLKDTPEEVFIPQAVSRLVISQDTDVLLGAGLMRNILVWYLNEQRPGSSFTEPEDQVTELALSVHDAQMACGLKNGDLLFYANPVGERLLLKTIPKAHSDAISGLAYSWDGAYLASTSRADGLVIWNAHTFTEVNRLKEVRKAVIQLAFTPDNRLVVVDAAQKIEVWNTFRGTLSYSPKSGFLPSGQIFAPGLGLMLIAENPSSDCKLGCIHVIRYASGEPVITLQEYRPTWLASFRPDEKLLVVGNTQKWIIWDTALWERVLLSPTPYRYTHCTQVFTPNDKHRQTLAIISRAAIVFDLNDRIRALCNYQPENTLLKAVLNSQRYAILSMIPQGLWLWGMDPRENTSNMSTIKIERVDDFLAVSEKGTLLLYSYTVDNGKEVGSLRKIRFLALKNIRNMAFSRYPSRPDYNLLQSFPNQQDYQYVAAISPDDRLLALGSQYGVISIWAVLP